MIYGSKGQGAPQARGAPVVEPVIGFLLIRRRLVRPEAF
jgi:hypothetical protein